MIKNYFKLAFRVLAGKKFFTFISLFGISITLMVLMIFTSFVESQLGSNPPMSDKDKMVFVDRLKLKRVAQDTIMTIDSLKEDGVMSYDTSYSYNEVNQSTSTSSLSFYCLDTYLKELDNLSKFSFFSLGHSSDIFINNTKITFKAIYSDAAYFDVFDFDFLEGSPWDEQSLNNQEQVMVITQKAALEYYGTDKNIVGKELIMEKKHFRVTGVVATPPAILGHVSSDLYIPYTNLEPSYFSKEEYMGSFGACFVAKSKNDIALVKEQIKFQGAKLEPIGENYQYNRSEIRGETFGENFSQEIYYDNDAEQSRKILLGIVSFLLLLFVLLPVINLIKVNVSRIIDRSIEIGVRKAFGANQRDIIFQFVFENIVLTVLGGIIGFVFTVLVIKILNETQAMGPIILTINYKMVIYSILITIGFGIISGLLPAFRVSKIHIVNALNQIKL